MLITALDIFRMNVSLVILFQNDYHFSSFVCFKISPWCLVQG